ncbi:MAG: hypothetical protein MI757_21260 [Pirellulales bacterium]|nr:hypothetical protein [Pirellulales bacterium]
MATADSHSSHDLVFEPITPGEEALVLRESAWENPWSDPEAPELEGEVLSCSCPECGSPMAVRLWLQLADCLSCRISIEMTEEMEREARRHLEKQPRASAPKNNGHREPSAAMPTVPAPTVNRTKPQPKPVKKHAPAPVRAPIPAAPQPKRSPKAAPVQVTVRRRHNDWLKILPASLISMIIHTIVLVLLGLWIIREEPLGEKPLNLQVAIGHGGVFEVLNKSVYEVDGVKFELPVPEESEPKTKQQKTELKKANDDAQTANVVQEGQEENLPDISETLQEIASPGQGERSLAGRDPRVRSYLVRKEGGTTLTEAAVARGLRWLAQHQHPDGRWSIDKPYFPKGVPRYSVAGKTKNDVAATSLGLLPFLGAGKTDRVGDYTEEVGKGLRWLLAQQKTDGDLRGNANDHSAFYAHGLASIVLSEAYSLTRDPKIGLAAQRAIDFIVRSQHAGGGWRYKIGEPGDTSVVGWQLMALHSAKIAGLNVPKITLSRAEHFLDTVKSGAHGGFYSYLKGQRTTNVMTAEGLLCRMYLGWHPEHPGVNEGIKYLTQSSNLPKKQHRNMYYHYYGTQLMKQVGGAGWDQWNTRMRQVLTSTQEVNGPGKGSWSPSGDKYASQGGRLFTTSLAICTLEVYYRQLPLYRKVGE